ncbi:MAG TPA: polyprenyl synthetase family protein [Blastocatellia bacterium]|jgi:octaprenyl-diphosphate synthase|nr:polyprenyl synthetase family protein [Blastocatellia bacterium]
MTTPLHVDALHEEDARMTPQEIFSLVGRDLVRVEEEFYRHTQDASEVVSSIVRYMHEGGGKRVRPALLLLASKLVSGEAGESAFRMAAVMEMLHTATLVHDDIIDEAGVRRGRESANAKWGNDITVLIGDWLYMTAYEMSLAERDFDILDVLTGMTRFMVDGEIMQLAMIGNSRISETEHLEIVRRKTACMFSACAEVGGIVAGASREERRALARYGQTVGIAFQLVDDVLDFVSTEEKLGKPVANDLREGKLTLPLIYLMEEGNAEHRKMIETVMRERTFESVKREDVLRLIGESGSLSRARSEALRYADEALDALNIFPPSLFRQALASVPRFIIERDM